MSDTKSAPDPLLLQMTATLSEIKTSQGLHADRVEKNLSEINGCIRDFGERLIALEKDRDAMQVDIAKRTHVEETNRIKQRVDALADDVSALEKNKAGKGWAATVATMAAGILAAMITAVWRLSFGVTP